MGTKGRKTNFDSRAFIGHSWPDSIAYLSNNGIERRVKLGLRHRLPFLVFASKRVFPFLDVNFSRKNAFAMAKPKTSTVKPLTSRPLDLLYYVFFVIHLLITIFIDLLPLWPTVLRELPITKQLFGVLKGVADDYVKQTNDPFALVMWGLVDREWEFMYAKVFMWMEV